MKKIKIFLYQQFIRWAPQGLRDRYVAGMVAVPREELRAKYGRAIRYLKDEGRLGDYLEFGVFKGDSMLSMHEAMEDEKVSMRMFGFDSFEGLPAIEDEEDKKLPWQEGEYKWGMRDTRRHLTRGGVDWKRTFLIKGWFSKTLTPALKKKHAIRKASVIMIDCDLYSSTKEALAFCGPLIKDKAIILFDDWDIGMDLARKGLGEKRAFDEFLADNPDMKVEQFDTYTHVQLKHPHESKIFLVTRQGA